MSDSQCVNCGTRLGIDCGEAEPDYDSQHCSLGCFEAKTTLTLGSTVIRKGSVYTVIDEGERGVILDSVDNGTQFWVAFDEIELHDGQHVVMTCDGDERRTFDLTYYDAWFLHHVLSDVVRDGEDFEVLGPSHAEVPQKARALLTRIEKLMGANESDFATQAAVESVSKQEDEHANL